MLDLCYNYVVSMILLKFYRQLRKRELLRNKERAINNSKSHKINYLRSLSTK